MSMRIVSVYIIGGPRFFSFSVEIVIRVRGVRRGGVQWVTGNPPFKLLMIFIVHVQAWRIGRVNGYHQILGCCRQGRM